MLYFTVRRPAKYWRQLLDQDDQPLLLPRSAKASLVCSVLCSQQDHRIDMSEEVPSWFAAFQQQQEAANKQLLQITGDIQARVGRYEQELASVRELSKAAGQKAESAVAETAALSDRLQDLGKQLDSLKQQLQQTAATAVDPAAVMEAMQQVVEPVQKQVQRLESQADFDRLSLARDIERVREESRLVVVASSNVRNLKDTFLRWAEDAPIPRFHILACLPLQQPRRMVIQLSSPADAAEMREQPLGEFVADFKIVPSRGRWQRLDNLLVYQLNQLKQVSESLSPYEWFWHNGMLMVTDGVHTGRYPAAWHLSDPHTLRPGSCSLIDMDTTNVCSAVIYALENYPYDEVTDTSTRRSAHERGGRGAHSTARPQYVPRRGQQQQQQQQRAQTPPRGSPPRSPQPSRRQASPTNERFKTADGFQIADRGGRAVRVGVQPQSATAAQAAAIAQTAATARVGSQAGPSGAGEYKRGHDGVPTGATPATTRMRSVSQHGKA